MTSVPIRNLARLIRLLVVLCLPYCLRVLAAEPVVLLPKSALQPDEVAVVVNDDDALSRAIGAYYRQRRGIPESNMIRIRFKPGRAALPPKEFLRLWQDVHARTPPKVQAYALAWALPFRVDCMSITSAFATGYDPRYCAAQRCAPTQPSPYFDSDSHVPFSDFKLRPAIALAALNIADARALIDRGIAADQTWPTGTGYLLNTSDKDRSVRANWFQPAIDLFGDLVRLKQVRADSIRDVDDVLFYFTGVISVEHLETLRFVPGAIADHLTSSGGKLTGGKQMSSLRWLEAGATGSYGTVVEPCAYPQKFPVPGIVIDHYLRGESLIEAYWKSVAWPGEGVFIGEPLANPYGGYRLRFDEQGASLRTQTLLPGRYRLESAAQSIGPYHPERTLSIQHRGLQDIDLGKLTQPYYRVVPENTP